MLIRYFVVYMHCDELGGAWNLMEKTDILNELKLPVICGGRNDISVILSLNFEFLFL